jgi:hypothetical protein
MTNPKFTLVFLPVCVLRRYRLVPLHITRLLRLGGVFATGYDLESLSCCSATRLDPTLAVHSVRSARNALRCFSVPVAQWCSVNHTGPSSLFATENREPAAIQIRPQNHTRNPMVISVPAGRSCELARQFLLCPMISISFV